MKQRTLALLPLWIVALIGLLCAAACAQTAGGITETRLPNGLVVLTKEVHASPVVCTYVWYRVGSRNELPGITGVSHQLEHMMFKGTKKEFPDPGYIDLLIGRYGGQNNAETDTDTTSYYLLLPSDQLDLALRIEADRMTQAAMDPKQLDAEKTVVLSELEGDENDNSYFLYENTRATAYQYHPYHFPIIGTKWDVQHFTRAQVYDYYRVHYAPNNATLVVVGDFDTPKLLSRIRELWKDVRPSVIPHPPLNPEPLQRGERRVLVRRAGATAYLQAMYHIPAANHKDLPALTVLATALSSGRSSRLYKALVETQLAASVGAGANTGVDPETFDLSASARTGVAPEKIESALLAELERIKKEPLTEQELQKARNQTRAGFLFAQESVESQASRIGYFQSVTGDWHNLLTYVSRINAVTTADVRRVAQTYFTADNRTIGTFIPNGETPTADSDAGTGRTPHYRPIHSPPSILEKKLPNGMRVIIRENHANPTVTVGGFVRAGSVNDPAGKYGLAAMTAEMLTRGTASRTSQQIAETADFVGAGVGAQAGRERTDLSATMLSENFKEILALLADCARHPNFPAEELEKVRGETLTALKEADDDTNAVATRRLYQALYPDSSPFQHEVAGRSEEVKNITRQDVLDFYQKAYRPERATLVIVGDVKAAEAFAAVETLFGDWKGKGEPLPNYTPELLSPSLSAPAPLLITLPDKSQDDVAVGVMALSRKSPDYEAARLMNLILGEDTFVGRVGKRVRDTEGLAYYAYTAFAPGWETGPWMFRAGVNPKNVEKALVSAREEIQKMAQSGVTDAELTWAKDHSIGSLRLSLATNAGVAAQLENAAFYDLGLDYAERYPGLVRSLTKTQVNAAARKYLRSDALAVIVVGPPVPGMKASEPK